MELGGAMGKLAVSTTLLAVSAGVCAGLRLSRSKSASNLLLSVSTDGVNSSSIASDRNGNSDNSSNSSGRGTGGAAANQDNTRDDLNVGASSDASMGNTTRGRSVSVGSSASRAGTNSISLRRRLFVARSSNGAESVPRANEGGVQHRLVHADGQESAGASINAEMIGSNFFAVDEAAESFQAPISEEQQEADQSHGTPYQVNQVNTGTQSTADTVRSVDARAGTAAELELTPAVRKMKKQIHQLKARIDYLEDVLEDTNKIFSYHRQKRRDQDRLVRESLTAQNSLGNETSPQESISTAVQAYIEMERKPWVPPSRYAGNDSHHAKTSSRSGPNSRSTTPGKCTPYLKRSGTPTYNSTRHRTPPTVTPPTKSGRVARRTPSPIDMNDQMSNRLAIIRSMLQTEGSHG